MTDELECRLAVLLKESDQVQETIAKSMSTANAIFGTVLPVVAAFLLYTANAGEQKVPSEFLAFTLGAVVALAMLMNAGLWVEISRYLRYKYLVLYPRMYALAGLEGRQNLGKFLALKHAARPMWPTAAFHAVSGVLAGVLSLGGILVNAQGPTKPLLLAGVIAFFAVALVASKWAAVEVLENLRAIGAGVSEDASSVQ